MVPRKIETQGPTFLRSVSQAKHACRNVVSVGCPTVPCRCGQASFEMWLYGRGFAADSGRSAWAVLISGRDGDGLFLPMNGSFIVLQTTFISFSSLEPSTTILGWEAKAQRALGDQPSPFLVQSLCKKSRVVLYAICPCSAVPDAHTCAYVVRTGSLQIAYLKNPSFLHSSGVRVFLLAWNLG